jgi:hypothetical protein
MARFSGIPALPQSNIDPAVYAVISALKENVELLTGTRGEADGASVALTKSSLTVAAPSDALISALTAKGYGVTISGVSVPTQADYLDLLRDVSLLLNDVIRLRATLQTLVSQLRT